MAFNSSTGTATPMVVATVTATSTATTLTTAATATATATSTATITSTCTGTATVTATAANSTDPRSLRKSFEPTINGAINDQASKSVRSNKNSHYNNESRRHIFRPRPMNRGGHHHRPPQPLPALPPRQGGGAWVGLCRPPSPLPYHMIPPWGFPNFYDTSGLYPCVQMLPRDACQGAPQHHRVAYPLHIFLLNQIQYYFSDDNLPKDYFLRSNMDAQGWVPISLIAGFPRVRRLKNDIQLILNSLRDSTLIEVQGHNVRRRHNWEKWILANRSSCMINNVHVKSKP